MNKKMFVALVLAVPALCFVLAACGPIFEKGQVVVAQEGGIHLYSDLNLSEPIDTCALGTRDGESFIVEEVSSFGPDQLSVYRLRSIDRKETDLLWGCHGWVDPNDVDKFTPYGQK